MLISGSGEEEEAEEGDDEVDMEVGRRWGHEIYLYLRIAQTRQKLALIIG